MSRSQCTGAILVIIGDDDGCVRDATVSVDEVHGADVATSVNCLAVWDHQLAVHLVGVW